MQNLTSANRKQERFQTFNTDKFLSDRQYNQVIGAVLLYGFIINAIMIVLFEQAVTTLFITSPFIVLIGYIVFVILGAILTANPSPGISFIGYNLIVIPVGVILTPFVNAYEPGLVFRAIVLTGIVTLLMLIAGSIWPGMFLKMGRTLFIALIAVIIAELAFTLIFRTYFMVFDFIVILIFAAYIGYDWAKANVYPKTLNNAIDCAADLYMDIINIFIRILSILGNRD